MKQRYEGLQREAGCPALIAVSDQSLVPRLKGASVEMKYVLLAFVVIVILFALRLKHRQAIADAVSSMRVLQTEVAEWQNRQVSGGDRTSSATELRGLRWRRKSVPIPAPQPRMGLTTKSSRPERIGYMVLG
jgi:hypothetical protein